MKCYACGEKNEEIKYTHIQDGRTYYNFPMNKCTSCEEGAYSAGALIYFPTYAKHFGYTEFDCDSISWKDLCEWIRNNKPIKT